MPVLEISGVTKVYESRSAGALPALHDLSLRLESGDVFGLVGLNGAGKSTTNKIILGFTKPSSGSATVCGHSAGTRSARHSIGYLPENLVLDEALTGSETLDYMARLSGVTPGVSPGVSPGVAVPTAIRRTELVAQVGLEAAEHRAVRGYSRGMRQRLGIATAFIHDPRLLILDEPFSGLDPRGRRMLRELVLKARDHGVAVLLTTHQLLEAQELCSRFGILHKGRLLGIWTREEVQDSRTGTSLEHFFLETLRLQVASGDLADGPLV